MYERVVLAAAVLCTACGGETTNNDNAHEGEMEVSVEADACEHMAEGPAQAVEAVAIGGAAISVADTHTRYDITVAGGSGIVLWEAAEATEMHFFFDKGVDLTVADSTGAEITAEEAISSVAECTEVAEGSAYDLEVGTYTLTIATEASDVSMVPVPAEHEHEQ